MTEAHEYKAPERKQRIVALDDAKQNLVMQETKIVVGLFAVFLGEFGRAGNVGKHYHQHRGILVASVLVDPAEVVGCHHRGSRIVFTHGRPLITCSPV